MVCLGVSWFGGFSWFGGLWVLIWIEVVGGGVVAMDVGMGGGG